MIIFLDILAKHAPWFLREHYHDHYENLKSMWTGLSVLLLLWITSLFMKHTSDAYLQQHYDVQSSLSEERRQITQTPLVRSRLVTWGDRFKRGALTVRSSFIMLLAGAIFASLPVRHPCPPPLLTSETMALFNEPKLQIQSPLQMNKNGLTMHPIWVDMSHSKLTNEMEGSLNKRSLQPPSPPFDERLIPNASTDMNMPEDLPFPPPPPRIRHPKKQHPRPPSQPPEKPPPGVAPPSPPTVPAPPLPPDVGEKVCYRNNVEDSVVILTWIFVGLNLLWYVMELSLVEPASSALTRSIMGTFTYPLVIAILSIVLSRSYA